MQEEHRRAAVLAVEIDEQNYQLDREKQEEVKKHIYKDIIKPPIIKK